IPRDESAVDLALLGAWDIDKLRDPVPVAWKLIEHLKAGGVAEEDLSQEAAAALARALYGRRILSLGLAAELANVPRDEFVADVARRGLPLIDLPAEEIERELEAVDALLRRKKPK
ncbi:MAG: UPF0175 family protein, partial [Candidatus Brocadiia bacterium]|nr:UPF0175 family protein [Candidatus Brocadiia bacterium]